MNYSSNLNSSLCMRKYICMYGCVTECLCMYSFALPYWHHTWIYQFFQVFPSLFVIKMISIEYFKENISISACTTALLKCFCYRGIILLMFELIIIYIMLRRSRGFPDKQKKIYITLFCLLSFIVQYIWKYSNLIHTNYETVRNFIKKHLT